MESHYNSYFEYKMPIDKMISYYENYLKGHDKLNGHFSSTKLSEQMDLFVSSSQEEQYSKNVKEFKKNISELYLSEGLDSHIEIRKRLLTKYACILCIHDMRIVEWHQKQIEANIPDIINKLRDSVTSYSSRYTRVPKEYFDKMKLSIDSIHTDIENIKRMNIEDHFVQNAFPLFWNEISQYYWIMGLDYTPVSAKIEENTMGCVGHIITIAIPLLLIVVLAKACAG